MFLFCLFLVLAIIQAVASLSSLCLTVSRQCSPRGRDWEKELLRSDLFCIAQFLSMPLQSGTIPSLVLSLNTWNQSENEQYISSSVSPVACHICHNVLFVAILNSLKDRRDKLSRTFFQNMCEQASCLHHLLPPPS